MIRLLEHYTSTQGEGPRVGVMTQFVRFAGCNLRCPKWPCDSEFAIDPKQYRREQQNLTPEEMVHRIAKETVDTGASNICFTGGEPLLQQHKDLFGLIEGVEQELGDYFTFECFTNGTQLIDPLYLEYFVHFVMDWKLPGSGEDPYNSHRIQNIGAIRNWEGNAVKFVCKDIEDAMIAHTLWNQYLERHTMLQVYAGPVWGSQFTAEHLVDFIKTYKLPWKLNVQVHNYIYGAHKRGT